MERANGDQTVEEAIRARLERLERDERSAEAAHTIESLLAQSHRRDREVAAVERQVTTAGRSHARAFNARGYVQASSAMIDGRKLYILIATDGSTIAYLDVPPGLDIDRLLTRRLGVRGEPHFSEDLDPPHHGAQRRKPQPLTKKGTRFFSSYPGQFGAQKKGTRFFSGCLGHRLVRHGKESRPLFGKELHPFFQVDRSWRFGYIASPLEQISESGPNNHFVHFRFQIKSRWQRPRLGNGARPQ